MAIKKGNASNNNIDGTKKSDSLYGYKGRDTLTGNSGNDYLDGGAGSDKLYGGNGKDTLYAGAGNDTLYGGAGADVFVLKSPSDKIEYIKDFNPSEGDIIEIDATGFGDPAIDDFYYYSSDGELDFYDTGSGYLAIAFLTSTSDLESTLVKDSIEIVS